MRLDEITAVGSEVNEEEGRQSPEKCFGHRFKYPVFDINQHMGLITKFSPQMSN